MINSEHTWALVLAAGEGSRLRRLTTIADGVAVPKQFCSLQGGASLLSDALQRAQRVAPRRRICTIVAHQHRRWWESALRTLPASNVIVQPDNRGTANGILLPLLHIMHRDPDARVVLLPSDHYVRDEAVLTRALRKAVAQLDVRERDIILLGLEPEEVDPELGYIVPGAGDAHGAYAVRRFVEKPSPAAAAQLIGDGALWNVFILAARAKALLALFEERIPEIVAQMRAAAAADARDLADPAMTWRLYRTLPTIDFSRHVMEGAENVLRVLATPACGWSDLGTPERVARTLRSAPSTEDREEEDSFFLSGHLNLAQQQSLMQVC